MVLKRKKKDEGPFKANRILDTSEVKVDQVFTRIEEKSVALFITNTEDEARRIGAEGYFGPTKFGGKGEYERGKIWITRAIYFPDNIPGAQFNEEIGREMRDSLIREGTVVPADIQFEKVESEKIYPISGAAVLKTDYTGYTELSGRLPVSLPIMKLCPYCNSEIHAACKECPVCGKKL